jgi:hypothetical protein
MAVVIYGNGLEEMQEVFFACQNGSSSVVRQTRNERRRKEETKTYNNYSEERK